MRRGRTVQIRMSSATAWNGSMTGRLCLSVTADCSKLVNARMLTGAFQRLSVPATN